MKALKFIPVMFVVMALALFIRVGDAADKIMALLKDSGISFNTAIAETKETSDSKAPAEKPENKNAARAETDKPDEHDSAPVKEVSDVDDDDQSRPASEITLLQQMNEQRQKLNEREVQLDSREALLKATEVQLQQKTDELTKLKSEIEALVKQAENKQDQQMGSLVKIYETMKPKDAAKIFDTLDSNVLLDLTGRMKEGKLAPVLAAMSPDRARSVTTELAARAQKIPKIEDAAAAAKEK